MIALPREKKTLIIKENANEAMTNRTIKKKRTLHGVNVSTEYPSPAAVRLNGI